MALKKPKKAKATGKEAEVSEDKLAKDIIDFLNNDSKLDVDVGFLTETGANVTRWVDSGSYSLNWLSSGKLNGGLPYGRIIECHGDPYTGKSLIATQVAVQAQRDGALVIYFDPEYGLDNAFVKRLGGDPDTIIAPKNVRTVEQFNETFVKIIEKFNSSGGIDRPVAVILDSLAMLSTKHELDAPEKTDYSKAKKIRQFFRMYMHDCYKHNILLFVINQVYDVIGQMFGPSKKASGGQGLPYASSQRYNMLTPKIESDDDDHTSGTMIKAKTIKNRVSIPFRTAYIRFTYESGLDKYGGLWELLFDGGGKFGVTNLGLIKKVKKGKNGGWEEASSGRTYIIPGVIVDENGEDIGFSKDGFMDVFSKDEITYVAKLQEIIDKKNEEPVKIKYDELTEEEKLLLSPEELIEMGVQPEEEDVINY